MGKMLDRDVLIDHLRRMMEARQIDRLPKSGYAKAIEDVAGCPTVEPGADRERILKALSICLPETENDGDKNCAECPNFGRCLNDNRDDVSLPVLMVEEIRALLDTQTDRRAEGGGVKWE